MPKEVSGEKSQERRLAAIVFTDIVGYSAMSAKNELDALNAVSEYEKTARPIWASHDGHEIKSLGDGTLVEFASSVEAVRCAVELQRAMHERNLSEPEDRQIRLRIGVHVGEIIHRNGDVFGDGVNVAARIQPLAPAEGVCFSEDVWRLVKDKLPVEVVRLGSGELKNLGRPIVVYRVKFPWDVSSATSDRVGLAMRRKAVRWILATLAAITLVAAGALLVRNDSPEATGNVVAPIATLQGDSLVVLPFQNLSDDPKLAHWSDGLSEELIGALSSVPHVSVIGRETAWSFKDKATDVREICRSLGVAAALEGSVRKEQDRIRVSVRMTDGKTGLAIWTEKYDEQLKNVFKVQELIATAVLARFQRNSGEDASPRVTTSSNVLAYDAFLQGQAHLRQLDSKQDQLAIQQFKKAIQLDPRFAPAYVGLARAYYNLSNVVLPPNEVMPKAREAAMKAIEIEPRMAEAYVMLGVVRDTYDWDWAGGEDAFRSALKWGPGVATAHEYLGNHLIAQGKFEEGLSHLETASRLDPQSLEIKFHVGFGYFMARRFDEAIQSSNDLTNLAPQNRQGRFLTADCYLESGRPELAEPIYRDLYTKDPLPPRVAHLVMVNMALGKRDKALVYLRELEEMGSKSGFVSSSLLGLAYGSVGRLDDAFRHWDSAFHDRSENMVSIAVDPHMDRYRSDPRFKQLLKQMKLPEVDLPPLPR